LQGKTHWKIADFGFAIESEDEITTKHNVGTPLYMPPEALIKNLYSPQSDIFAIGIIFYEMIIGVTPWECSSEKELIRRLTSLPLKIPSKARISLSTKHLL
jgi:serine/threonine-protein kinase ULK/ATG1